ncbi:MAG: hypothetical protein HOV67_10055 [Kribbellaceae bacterium]|nr:hypothetical protein [Kribbellaceae bacterium]
MESEGLQRTGGIVQGVPVSSALRDLMNSATSEQTTAARGTALTAMLGQLAVADATAAKRVLQAACGLAKSMQRLDGIEGVFLSALLGAPDERDVQDAASAAWADSAGKRTAAATELVPILDPGTGELGFLSSTDLSTLTPFALRQQVRALIAARGTVPGTSDDLTRFAVRVLEAASAVTSLSESAARPESDPQLAAARAALPQPAGSSRLAGTLVAGSALAVDLWTVGAADVLDPPGASWTTVWPKRVWGVAAGPVTPDPAIWRTILACAALPMYGPGLPGLVQQKERTVLLRSLPKLDPAGRVVVPGFTPDPGAAQGGLNGWVNAGSAGEVLGWPEFSPARVAPWQTSIILGGDQLHLLTGEVLGPYGQPVPHQPGTDPGGYGYSPEEARQIMIRACVLQDLDATGLTVGDALVEIAHADVGLSSRFA